MPAPFKNTGDPVNPATILIVEENPEQGEPLRGTLGAAGYAALVAGDGAQALAMAEAHRPAAVVSDIKLPLMDGFQLCQAIRASDILKSTPVILVTTLSDPNDVIKGLQAGADSFLTKPYDVNSLLSGIKSLVDSGSTSSHSAGTSILRVVLDGESHRLKVDNKRMVNLLISTYKNAVLQNRELAATQNALAVLNRELEQKAEEKSTELAAEVKKNADFEMHLENERRMNAERLQETFLSTIGAIGLAVEKRDLHTSGHQRRAGKLAAAMATEMGMAPARIEGLRVSGLVYDLGKIAVPSDILNRARALNKSELALVKVHPEAGYEILQGIDFPWPVAQIVLQHHERLDGSGYPAGLKGEAILLEARILGVADVVEAMSSHRPHRPALGIDAALGEIAQHRGARYDPDAADACIRLFREKKFAFGELEK